MKNNNKGSVILIVLITVALISVLATMILATTSISYKIKTLAETNNMNFYSCETALDEIKVGLQAESADCYVTKYMGIINDDSIIGDAKVTEFYKEYKLDMKSRLIKNNGDNKYSVENLESYLSDGMLYDSDTNRGIVIADAPSTSILIRADGILLKSVDVTYYKDDNNSTRIVTDILIKYPPVDFDKLTDNPPLMLYSLISNKQVSVNNDLNNKITGAIYCGNNNINYNSLIISGDNSKASLTISNAYKAVIDGDIILDNQSKLYTTGNSDLWARNILIDSTTYLETQGYLNLVNDLWIGKNGKVNIAGSYYGFGNVNNYNTSQYLIDNDIDGESSDDPRAEHTSAILINGKGAELNMERISYLLLGGSASIGTTDNNNLNLIKMGESIGIKGNQLAYMVPDSLMNNCKNPVLYSDDLNIDDCVNLNSSDYETVYYPLPGDVTMVYFFMSFDTVEEAADYFRAYYDNNSNYVNSIMDNYGVNISLPPEGIAEINAAGNTIEYSNTSSVSSNTFSEDSYITMSDREDIYGTLCTKLMEDYTKITEDEKSESVFDNIVDYDKYRDAFVGNYSDKPLRIYETEVTSQNITLTGIVVNDEMVKRVVLNDGSSNDGTGYKYNSSKDILKIYPNELNARIITTYNNVRFNGCNYTGLAITKGNTIIKKGSILTSNSADVSLTMFAENDDGEMYCDIFKNGGAYLIGGSYNEESVFSDLVVFNNWTKE